MKEKAWLHKVTEMDREERLRRPREQDRTRRLKEAVEEREHKLSARHAGMTNLQ